MKKIKYFIPAVIWMIFIFIESSMTAQTSSGQSNIIVDMIHSWFPVDNSQLDMISFLVRKCAHITEYIILTLFIYYGFYKNDHTSLLYTFLISLIYAGLDEFHQLFVPGRSGQFQDVMIDSIGIIIGLCCISIFQKIKKNRHLSSPHQD